MADDIRLRLVGFIPWGDRLEPAVGPSGPAPGSGAIEVPGRRPVPVRTRLEPATGPAGLVGRVVDPDGRPRSVIARWDAGAAELIDVGVAPLALAPRSDAVWCMDREQLTAVTGGGAILTHVGVSGIRMLAASADAVWVCGLDRCAYVAASGTVSDFVSPWRDAFDACLVGDGLTGWDPERPGGVVSIDQAGVVRRRDLGVEHAPLERPLAFGRREAWSAVLRTLMHRDPSGERSLVMTGAGMTTDGVAFFAGHTENRTWLWLGDAAATELRAEVSEQVVAVSANRVLVRSGESATWLAPGSPQPGTDTIDEPAGIVEVGWAQDDPCPFVVAPDGELLTAASGPAGVAVLGLRWPPV